MQKSSFLSLGTAVKKPKNKQSYSSAWHQAIRRGKDLYGGDAIKKLHMRMDTEAEGFYPRIST